MLIAIVIAITFQGMRTGLIGAALATLGGVIGCLLAGQVSGAVGEAIGDSATADRWVTVVSYAIIIILCVVVASIVGRFVRPVLTAATLGMSAMVDKLGGLVLGLVLGVALSAAVIIGLARLTYNFELPEKAVLESVARKIPNVQETRERIEDALTGSAIVPVSVIDVANALPGDALGFIPSDFQAALDILDQNIDGEGSS